MVVLEISSFDYRLATLHGSVGWLRRFHEASLTGDIYKCTSIRTAAQGKPRLRRRQTPKIRKVPLDPSGVVIYGEYITSTRQSLFGTVSAA